MDIQAYFHCKACFQSGDEEKLEIGAADPTTLVVQCATCEQPVGIFTLAKPLPPMNCGVCNEPLGPNHHH